jgi:ribosomal protein L33
VNRSLFGETVFEGLGTCSWDNNTKVLDVHWVQAVCDPRENCGSRQDQQRALSTTVCHGCPDMLYITTAMQNCYITKINGKEKQERNRFNEYCKQCAFYSHISHAWPIDHMK